MNDNKNYRPNVAAVILSSKYPNSCEIMMCQRSDLKNVWQFPQCGIDRGEDPKTALLRELKEEIGTNDVQILSEHPDWLSYDFPEHIKENMKPFDGQRQKYFLVKLNKSAKINLETEIPEFVDYKFEKTENIIKNSAHFKKHIYKKVLYHFKRDGYL
jgi:putative (di)nucleoside polyphosphate hydrolase